MKELAEQPDAATRTPLRQRLQPPGLDVGAFAALLALNAWTGGEISRLEVNGNALHLTEIGLALVALLAIGRLGPHASLQVLRRAAPLWLGLFAVAGLVAGARGVLDHGFSASLYDIELFVFAAALPIAVLIADTKLRRDWLLTALVAVCAVATFLFLGAEVVARATDDTSLLADQEGEIGAGAFYACFTTIWAICRLIRDEGIPKLALTVGGLAMILVVISDKRTAWVAVLGALAVILILGRGRRSALAAGIALLAIAAPLGLAIDAATSPTPATATAAVLASSSETDSAVETEPGQAERELEGFLGGEGAEGENVEWRLAFWEELLDRLGSEPSQIVTGAGFGPMEFDRGDSRYDYRIPGSADSNNTSGPHNAFVGVLYLTGIAGLAGLVGLLLTAAARLVRELRGMEDGRVRADLITLGAMLVIGVVYMSLTESLRAGELGPFIWAAVGLALASASLPPDEAPAPADLGPERSGS